MSDTREAEREAMRSTLACLMAYSSGSRSDIDELVKTMSPAEVTALVVSLTALAAEAMSDLASPADFVRFATPRIERGDGRS